MISKHFLVTINLVSNKTDTSSGMSEHIVQKVISNATMYNAHWTQQSLSATS